MVHLSAFLLSGLLVQGRNIPEQRCRASPDSHDWPSAGTWKQLDEAVSGKLIKSTPPASVCHKDWPDYNDKACKNLAKEWKTYEWHAQNPVSVMWDNFSNDTCLPRDNVTCSDKGYPAYVVNATAPEHVKAGVDFARRHNVRLVVKSTGHDYLGRSIAPGALSIWTHHLNDIQFHKGSFKLTHSEKTIPGDAMTVGAGTEMYDAYTVADQHGRAIVGGGGKTVGISGYITGAGHSILAPRRGLAADQVLEVSLVTPAGEIVTANEDNHPDLFWAMRGGGGSTFGVLTSITIKTYPTPKILNSHFFLSIKPDNPHIKDIISYVLGQFPYFDRSGLSGYTYLSLGNSPIPIVGEEENAAGIAGSFILQDSTNPKDLERIYKPVNDTIQKRWGGQVQFVQGVDKYASFFDWFNKNYDMSTAGGDQFTISRLLDEKALTGSPKDLSAALEAAVSTTGYVAAFLVSGKGVHDAKPRGGSDAVNPGWRSSYVHMVSGAGFPPFNETAKRDTVKKLNKAYQPLRELSPDTGAYINEALTYEPDWQKTFWGSNYKRLLSIKKSVDPTDVFWCQPCVGNEGWALRQDGRLCKV